MGKAQEFTEQESASFEEILSICNQRSPTTFDKIFKHKDHLLETLGERGFSRCYANPRMRGRQRKVFKIIPIQPMLASRGQASLESNFDRDPLSVSFRSACVETRIAYALHELRTDPRNRTGSFCRIKQSWLVLDQTPKLFKWDNYMGDSQSLRPECVKKLKEEYFKMATMQWTSGQRYYIVHKMEYGGESIHGKLIRREFSPREFFSSICQIICSLAASEAKLEFEHRDLHYNNILVRPTRRKWIKFIVRGERITIPTHGIKITLIDFGFSRATLDGKVYFNPMQVEQGDFRNQQTKGNWSIFCPKTNLFTLQDIMSYMIYHIRIRHVGSEDSFVHAMVKTLSEDLLSFPDSYRYFRRCIHPLLQYDKFKRRMNAFGSHRIMAAVRKLFWKDQGEEFLRFVRDGQ